MPSAALLRLALVVLGGAAPGALPGWFGPCSGGICPLTASWWRGAPYGGFPSLLAALSSARTG